MPLLGGNSKKNAKRQVDRERADHALNARSAKRAEAADKERRVHETNVRRSNRRSNQSKGFW